MSDFSSRARVRTEAPGRYMRQMCSHFGHKIPATYDDAGGEVVFPFGTCRFRVEEGVLELSAESATEEELVRLQGVIDKHLVRFAWRETLEIAWERTPAPALPS